MLRPERLSDESSHRVLQDASQVLTFLLEFLSDDHFSKEKDHVTPGSVPAEVGSDGEGIKIAGGSVIIDPMGKILAGPLRGKEG